MANTTRCDCEAAPHQLSERCNEREMTSTSWRKRNSGARHNMHSVYTGVTCANGAGRGGASVDWRTCYSLCTKCSPQPRSYAVTIRRRQSLQQKFGRPRDLPYSAGRNPPHFLQRTVARMGYPMQRTEQQEVCSTRRCCSHQLASHCRGIALVARTHGYRRRRRPAQGVYNLTRLARIKGG